MPDSLYSWQAPSAASASTTRDVIDTVVTVDQPVGWFIPAVATGVPGVLIIAIVAVQLVLGVSWLPGLGRLLGPEPDRPDDDSHLWWANGRPMD
jgi:hypothetical protein